MKIATSTATTTSPTTSATSNGFGLGHNAVDGDDNSASEFGNMTGTNDGSFAGNGTGDIASYVGNVDNSDITANAGGTYGTAVTGSHDVATSWTLSAPRAAARSPAPVILTSPESISSRRNGHRYGHHDGRHPDGVR